VFLTYKILLLTCIILNTTGTTQLKLIYEAVLYATFWTDKLKIRKNTNEKCVVLRQCKWHSSFYRVAANLCYADGDFSARSRCYCHDMLKHLSI